MTNFDWFCKGTFFWLCVIYYLNTGIHGHHNDTCLSSDGRQAICVANRYCRERFKNHLISCGDSKICCPIPTASSPSTTTPSEEPTRRPSNSERPKTYPQDDVYSPIAEDGSPRKPVTSYEKPVKELPSTRPDKNERPRYSSDIDDTQDRESKVPPRRPVEKVIPKYNLDDSPPNSEEDGRSRRPITKYDRPSDESPPRRTDVIDRPKVYSDDLLPSLSEDGRSRKPISVYEKPVEDPPSRRPVESGRLRPNADNIPRVTGSSRRPINTHSKPAKDLPPRRPISNERPRQNKPTYDPMDDREYERKPVDVYDEPVYETPSRTRDENSRPIGRPRYDDPLERPKPGKVRFDEDDFRDREDRPSKPFQSGRPSETDLIDMDDDSRSEYYPMPRRESSTSNKRRHDSEIADKPPRFDDDKRRPTGDLPSYYPSEDDIEVHRDPPKRASKPTRVLSRNHSIDVPKSTHEIPEFLASQPKVPECGVKPYELFIAGGEASEPHEWPWMTAIFRRHQSYRPKTFICGGALINTKYILTAAHCFVHNYVILPASTFVVRVGSHQLSSGEEYTVSDLVIHHNHSGSDFFNDIALLKLASQVYVTDKVAPICLPFRDMETEDFVGRTATVAGWGDTAFRTGGTRTLQHVTIPIVSSDECFAAYSRVRGAAFLARGSDHVICAGLREGGKDACLGDSGGPLMLKTTEDRWIVVGIVSLGYKCAEPGYPGVYTRVTHYLSWIQNNMKRH